MSLQIECSVNKRVTIRAAKRLEGCIDVVHVAYVVVVSQQPHSIFVFLHTSSSKFFDNVPIHNIYIIQENAESKQIFNSRNIVNVNSLEVIGVQSVQFLINKMNNSELLFPVVDFRACGEQEHKKDTCCCYMVVLYFRHT